MSYLTRGVSGKEELTPYHQAEEFRRGQKVKGQISVYALPLNWTEPPKILLTGVHLGWGMCAWPGRTLNQNGCPETIQKLTPLPWRDCEPHNRASLLGSLPRCFRLSHPPGEVSCFASTFSPQTIHSWVLDKFPLPGPWRDPPSYNEWQFRWGFFSTKTDILRVSCTQGPACPLMDQT